MIDATKALKETLWLHENNQLNKMYVLKNTYIL